MPTPDVAEYLGLELTTLDDRALFEAAVARAQAVFPGWVPQAGHTEVVLLEVIAGMVAEMGYAINRVPDGLTEVMLRLFGLERDQGASPTVSVKFTLSDAAGHTVPAGTSVRLSMPGDNDEPLDLTTTSALVIPGGSTTGTVSATGAVPSAAANGIPAGTLLTLLDGIPWVSRVELAAASSGGRDAETGEEFLDRARPALSALTTTIVRPIDMASYVAANYADVARVRAVDVGVVPALPPSIAAVLVLGEGGSEVPVAIRTAITNALKARVHAGLLVTCSPFTVRDFTIDVTVLPYASATGVAEAVQAAIATYVNPDTWPFGNTLFLNELVAVVDRAAGVDVVSSLTVGPFSESTGSTGAQRDPAGNITFGYAVLPRVQPAAVNVTVASVGP